MSIWSRLGSIINSYLNDSDRINPNPFTFGSKNDPDLDAAYEELDDYLNNPSGRQNTKQNTTAKNVILPPDELKADFECLGVPFGADFEVCKTAYKNLLKIHHPDRHAGHEGNIKKATLKSAGINAAWDRICKWYQI